MTDIGSQCSASLRKRAETLAARMPDSGHNVFPEGVRDLIYELAVHQIQLELQNEELERTRRQIEKARDAYTRLYDLAPVGFLTLDEAGVILQSNRTFARMIGISDPQGKFLRDFVADSGRDTFAGRYPAFFRFPGEKCVEVDLKQPGGVLHARLIGRSDPGVENTPNLDPPRMRLLLAVHDITEQKKVEQAFRDSEMRWQFALEGASEGIWDWNVAAGEVFLSERCRQMLGYDEGTLCSFEQWVNELHPDDRERCLGDLNRHLDGEGAVYESSHRVRRRDGQYAWVLVRAKAMERAADGRPVRVIGTQTDITARRQTEAQLAQRQKMESIGSLAAGVAHDFNNFLTIINGYSTLLLSRLDEADPVRATVAQIHSAGERASALTRRLLLFSRQRSGEPTLVDLDDVVRHMEAILPRLVGEDVKMCLRLASGGALVLIDRHQVEQVVMNLAANARDAMPAGGQLTIGTSVVEQLDTENGDEEHAVRHVVLTVQDSGTGMDEEVRRRAMEPFFTTKEVGKGTGLGLSIVHGIVTQAGGRVDVESQPGLGTCFRIYLPVAASERPVAHRRRREAGNGRPELR